MIKKFNKLYKKIFFDYSGQFLLIKWIYNCFYKLSIILYPNNVIKIQSLDKHYHNKDELMLHSNFQILCDFVEYEMFNRDSDIFFDVPKEFKSLKDMGIEESKIKTTIDTMQEININFIELIRLYDWWKEQRPKRELSYPHCPNLPKEDMMKPIYNEQGEINYYELVAFKTEKMIKWSEEYRKYEEMCEKEDNEKLMKLISLRKIFTY